MDHTDLPANYTMPAFTPQPQSITALWLYAFYCFTEGRRLSRPGLVSIAVAHARGTRVQYSSPALFAVDRKAVTQLFFRPQITISDCRADFVRRGRNEGRPRG